MQHVGVLRGGVGEEHEVSLKSGLTVLRRLSEIPSFKATDIFIDRDGVWFVRGVPMQPSRALTGVDVVFNALHGRYGEDGQVQKELERLGVAYTGPTPGPAALAMHKGIAKEMVARRGVRVARHAIISVTPDIEARATELWRVFPQPSVVKPADSGSSVGVTLAKSFTQFLDGIKKAFQHAHEVMVEEFVKGREATVGVIDRFRGSDVYTLPPVEIVLPQQCEIFDYDAKYGGTTIEKCPSSFSRAEVEELERMARVVHETLGLRHYSRSDFIVTPAGPYFLEANALPGLTDQSLVPKALGAVGASLDEFLAHVISLALEKKR